MFTYWFFRLMCIFVGLTDFVNAVCSSLSVRYCSLGITTIVWLLFFYSKRKSSENEINFSLTKFQGHSGNRKLKT